MNSVAAQKETIRFHAVGDIAPRRVEYGEAPESIFAGVVEKLRDADVTFCQLEEILSAKGSLQYRDFPTWYARVNPENVKSLVYAGFNVVSHASNHSYDYGPEALVDSIDVLRNNGINVIGAGRDIAEARKPAFVERNGIILGFLAYNSILPSEYEAREAKPGCNPIRVSTYYESQEYQAGTPPRIITIPLEDDVLAMEEDIRRLRNQVDIVVVSMHWGIHFIPGMLAMYQHTVGHRAIDAGADLIVGHHAHLIKGIEIYKERAIFYSLGNFAQETPWHETPPPGVHSKKTSRNYRNWEVEPGWERYGGPPDKRYSMMVRCVVGKNAIEKVSFLPVWINQRAEPEFLSSNDERFQEVLRYIEPWCQELGTTLNVEGDEVCVYDSAKK